jgi:hypothetical protein
MSWLRRQLRIPRQLPTTPRDAASMTDTSRLAEPNALNHAARRGPCGVLTPVATSAKRVSPGECSVRAAQAATAQCAGASGIRGRASEGRFGLC